MSILSRNNTHHHYISIHPHPFNLAHHLKRSWALIPTNYKLLHNEAREIVTVEQIVSFGFAVGGVFTTIFLWRETNDIKLIALYNLVQYPTILTSFLAAGAFFVNSKLKNLIKIGISFYILNYIFLIVFSKLHSGSNLILYILLMGFVYGLGAGFYYAGINPLEYKTTKDTNRDLFNALNSSISSFIAVFIPPVIGLLLSYNFGSDNFIFNYSIIFIFTIVVFSIGLFYSVKLPDYKISDFNFKNLLQPVKSEIWKLICIRDLLDGFYGGTDTFLGTLLVFFILKREVNMGLFNSLLSILSILVTIKIGTWLNRNNRLRLGFIGAMLLSFGRVLYIGMFSIAGMIVSSLIALLGGPLFGIGLASTFFDAIDHSPNHEKYYFEYMVFREIFLAFGRTSGTLVFLIVLNTFGNQLELTKYWFLILGFMPLFYFYATKKFEGLIAEDS